MDALVLLLMAGFVIFVIACVIAGICRWALRINTIVSELEKTNLLLGQLLAEINRNPGAVKKPNVDTLPRHF